MWLLGFRAGEYSSFLPTSSSLLLFISFFSPTFAIGFIPSPSLELKIWIMLFVLHNQFLFCFVLFGTDENPSSGSLNILALTQAKDANTLSKELLLQLP